MSTKRSLKYCPLALSHPEYQLECLEEECAWWDSEFKQCYFLTIPETLEAILDYIKCLLDRR